MNTNISKKKLVNTEKDVKGVYTNKIAQLPVKTTVIKTKHTRNGVQSSKNAKETTLAINTISDSKSQLDEPTSREKTQESERKVVLSEVEQKVVTLPTEEKEESKPLLTHVRGQSSLQFQDVYGDSKTVSSPRGDEEEFGDSANESRIYEINNFMNLLDNLPEAHSDASGNRKVSKLSKFAQAAQENGNLSEIKELASNSSYIVTQTDSTTKNISTFGRKVNEIGSGTNLGNSSSTNFGNGSTSNLTNGSFST